MKPSHLILLALCTVAFFEIIMTSFKADLYNEQIVCKPVDNNVPKCGFILQKVIILIISGSSTIILSALSIKLKEKIFLVNFVIGVVSIVSVFIYMFGIVGNDQYKNIPSSLDKEFIRETFFPEIMEELAITV